MRGLYGGSLSLSHLAFGLSATPFSARRRYGQRAPIGVDKRGIVKEMCTLSWLRNFSFSCLPFSVFSARRYNR